MRALGDRYDQVGSATRLEEQRRELGEELLAVFESAWDELSRAQLA